VKESEGDTAAGACGGGGTYKAARPSSSGLLLPRTCACPCCESGSGWQGPEVSRGEEGIYIPREHSWRLKDNHLPVENGDWSNSVWWREHTRCASDHQCSNPAQHFTALLPSVHRSNQTQDGGNRHRHEDGGESAPPVQHRSVIHRQRRLRRRRSHLSLPR
jgi:hypothetical protein